MIWIETGCLLLGVIVGIFTSVYIRFSDEHNGYLLRAVRRLWPFLIVFGVVVTALGLLLFLGVASAMTKVWQLLAQQMVVRSISAFVFGVIASLYPAIFEEVVSRTATVNLLKKAWYAAIIRMHGMFHTKMARLLQALLEQDNFDWQQSHGDFDFRPDLDASGVSRRIRQLFQFCKKEIANKNRSPSMMTLDVGVHPGQLFYPTARLLGRRRLITCIREFAVPSNWAWKDGKERRRTRGTIAGRETGLNNRSRESDDQALLEAIERGRAC